MIHPKITYPIYLARLSCGGIPGDVWESYIIAPHIYDDRTLYRLSLANKTMHFICQGLKKYWDKYGKKIAFDHFKNLKTTFTSIELTTLANFYYRELKSRYLSITTIPPEVLEFEEIRNVFTSYLSPFFYMNKNPTAVHCKAPSRISSDSEANKKAAQLGKDLIQKIALTFSSPESTSKKCSTILQKVSSFVFGVLPDVCRTNGTPIFFSNINVPWNCHVTINRNICVQQSALLEIKELVRTHLDRLLRREDRLKILKVFLQNDSPPDPQKTLQLLKITLSVQEYYNILYDIASDVFYSSPNVPYLFYLFLQNSFSSAISLKDLRKLFFEIYYNYPKTLHFGFFDWKKLSDTEFLSLVLILFEIDRNIFQNCNAAFSDRIFSLAYANFYNYSEQQNKEKRELLATLFLQIVTRFHQNFAGLFDNLQKSPENTRNIVEQFLQIKDYQKETYLFFFLSSIHCTKYYWSEKQIYDICHAIAKKYPHFLQYLPLDRLSKSKKKEIIQLVKIQPTKKNFSKMFSLPKPMLEKEWLPFIIMDYCSLLSGKELIHFFRNIFGQDVSLENIKKHIEHKKIFLTPSQKEEIEEEVKKQKNPLRS